MASKTSGPCVFPSFVLDMGQATMWVGVFTLDLCLALLQSFLVVSLPLPLEFKCLLCAFVYWKYVSEIVILTL